MKPRERAELLSLHIDSLITLISSSHVPPLDVTHPFRGSSVKNHQRQTKHLRLFFLFEFLSGNKHFKTEAASSRRTSEEEGRAHR